MTVVNRIRSLAALISLSAALILAPWASAQNSSSGDATPSSNTPPAASQPAAQSPAPAANSPSQPAQNSTPGATATQPAQSSTPAATSTSQPAQTPASAAPAASTPAEDSTATDASKDKTHYSHNGGINDVDAVGNRNIGGKGLGNWYSTEKEIAMGKQYAQQIEASVKLVKDPVVDEYINRVGQNLVRNSDAKVPFTIKVIDSDSINAMALPGGFFYVNSGLILAADNEAELAGVMAHEIGHVAAHHVAREMTRSEWANLASIPLIFVGGGAGYAARMAASLALPVGFMKFSRGFEAQADYLGVEYMYKAGYDPEAFVSMMEKMVNLEKKKPGTIEKVFASHPATPDRVATAQKEIATILPPRDSYVLDTSEFEDVKARLAALENKHKIQDKKNANRPTLRRASADTTKGDQPPVLKRRDDSSQGGTSPN